MIEALPPGLILFVGALVIPLLRDAASSPAAACGCRSRASLRC